MSNVTGMSIAVNSTAVVEDVQPSYDGVELKCSENTNLAVFCVAVLRVGMFLNHVIYYCFHTMLCTQQKWTHCA